jgi:peptide/nickel transport system permease protein
MGSEALSVAHDVALEEAEDRSARRKRRRYLVLRLLHSPTFIIGALVLLFWVVVALTWRWIVPEDPFATTSATIQPPSAAHWLGTDDLGRDVLSRVLAGAADVLTIAPAAMALSILGGTILGLAAGYYRGLADDILMRTADVLIAMPALILAVVVLSALGTSKLILIVVIALLYTPLVGRTVRAVALGERSKDYVAAAQLRGEHGPYIMYREILPNIRGPIIVEATTRLGYAVFTSATLCFLGLGLAPPTPDWGVTIATERVYLQNAPWTVLAPAVALASLVLSVNFVADALRKVMGEA